MKEAVERYKTFFNIKNPVELVEPEQWQADGDTGYYFSDGAILFRNDPDEAHLLPYSFAELKLGINGHPLLAWPRFQQEHTEEDFESINLFATLVTPLREAWIYRIMKHFLPPEEFAREIEDFRYEAGLLRERVEENPGEADIFRRILSLLTYETVLYAMGELDDVAFPHHEHMVPEERLLMDQYVEGLKLFAARDPDVNLYAAIADALPLNFSVNIQSLPYPTSR